MAALKGPPYVAATHQIAKLTNFSAARHVSARHDVDLQARIGGGHVGRRQTELAADDVAALRDRARLVERNLAVAALPAEPAVARHDQVFGRNVLQRLS